MKGLAAKILLTCKKATELVEKKQNKRISFVENIQLKLHIWICKACAIYEKQSKIIQSFLHKISSNQATQKLSEESKKKILENLKD
ncbi:MAG: hypothetical protein MUC49_18930 [Raineya sp.]|jgi:hypothetical protein|nr:hypothetical protein [Raineya sp.]